MPWVALDLGSSNSVAAVLRDETPEVVPLRGQARCIPSVVAVDERGRFLVGRDARAQLLARPQDTIFAMKMILGRRPSAAFQHFLDNAPFRVKLGSAGAVAILGGQALPVLDAAAMVLKEVRGQAQDNLGWEIHDVTLPVPDYFTEEQRAALEEAARRAGARRATTVDESEALVPLVERTTPGARRVFLFGLGGGVLGATLLERFSSRLEVAATNGEDLGGADFDRRLAAHLHERFLEQSGLASYSDPVGRQRILEAAEAAKVRLDEVEEVPVQVPFLTFGADSAPVGLDVVLTRSEMARQTRDLLERCAAVAGSVLRASRVEPDDVDAVFVYGRQARSPLVLDALEAAFGRRPQRLPEAAAARGAVLLAEGAA